MVDTKTLQPENAVLFYQPDAVDINSDAIMGEILGAMGSFVVLSNIPALVIFTINQ